MSKTPGTRPWSPRPARAGARSDRRVGSGAGRGRRSSETQVVALIRQAGCRSFLNPCSRTRWNGEGVLCVAPGYQVLHLSTGSTVAARKYRPTPVAVVARRTASPAPDRTRSSTVQHRRRPILESKGGLPAKADYRDPPQTYIHTDILPHLFGPWDRGKWNELILAHTHTHTYYTAKFTQVSSRVFFGNFVL
jgi:hypothetical protein